MDSETERRIRERAYDIWVREGKPHGRHAQHWEAAQAEIAAEEREKAAPAAGKPGTPGEAAPEQETAPMRSRRAAGRAKAGAKTRASSTNGTQGESRRDR